LSAFEALVGVLFKRLGRVSLVSSLYGLANPFVSLSMTENKHIGQIVTVLKVVDLIG